jgi:hypothetical protein
LVLSLPPLLRLSFFEERLNALSVDFLDLPHRVRDLVAHVVAGEVEFGRSKAAGILDHQQ